VEWCRCLAREKGQKKKKKEKKRKEKESGINVEREIYT
jgi:hypothetical protein